MSPNQLFGLSSEGSLQAFTVAMITCEGERTLNCSEGLFLMSAERKRYLVQYPGEISPSWHEETVVGRNAR
jgi:hypothetical protein